MLFAIKPMKEFIVNPLGFPKEVRLLNFLDAWVKGNLGQFFWNTVVITTGTVLLVIGIASPAGFALSKLNLPGKNLIYNFFLVGLLIPFQALMIPLMRFSGILHLSNTKTLLVIIFAITNLSFPILIYTGYYKGIPYEMIEAAKLDGCGIIRLFIKIIFPLTTAINLTVAIFVGKVPWSDFFVPLVFTNDNSARTLAFGLFSFQSQYFTNWTLLFSMVIIISLPMIILFVIAQKYFVSGIMAGSVKG